MIWQVTATETNSVRAQYFYIGVNGRFGATSYLQSLKKIRFNLILNFQNLIFSLNLQHISSTLKMRRYDLCQPTSPYIEEHRML